MRYPLLISSVVLVAAAVLSGCRAEQQVAQGDTNHSSNIFTHRTADLTVPSGTSIDVTLGTRLSSEDAGVGSAWNGTTRNAFVLDGRNVIPVGSTVAGTVTAVRPARKGDRAMLDLEMAWVTIGNRNYRLHGTTESVTAGSTRARNLGAIGAATVAGAVVGHAIGGSDKGTIIGGLIGGGAATGVVSQTKGYQVVLKEGTPITFTTDETVAVRP
jgi:hypothetical protein